VYDSSAVPAPWRPGFGDQKKEDGAGEGMSGDDSDGKKGKWQDQDGAGAEGRRSADKWKGKERWRKARR
jgi:hypothetical protein